MVVMINRMNRLVHMRDALGEAVERTSLNFVHDGYLSSVHVTYDLGFIARIELSFLSLGDIATTANIAHDCFTMVSETLEGTSKKSSKKLKRDKSFNNDFAADHSTKILDDAMEAGEGSKEMVEVKEKRRKKRDKDVKKREVVVSEAVTAMDSEETQMKKTKEHKKRDKEDDKLTVADTNLKGDEGDAIPVDEGATKGGEKKQKQVMVRDGGTVEPSAKVKDAKKKSKRGQADIAEPAVDNALEQEPNGGKKKQKKDKRRADNEEFVMDGGESSATATDEQSAQKWIKGNEKNDKKRGGNMDEEPGGGDASKTTKKFKKRKALFQDIEGINTEKKAAKKRRKSGLTGLPDPEEDESLSEQAQKALTYAFIQFAHPSKWKFNKARQNWLLRNMWSEEMVPDVYMTLITRYLTNVQGGVRENLIKTCQNHLASTDSTSVTLEDGSAEAQTSANGSKAEIDTPKTISKSGVQDRAQAMLIALGVLVM
ncbi:hypothetical protein EW146_g3232 [Bondarzewia mesenterica]|uniref:WKF domain-containing protein n=1 Tax=Bondarzewia mesenterica TaxID=1095465 RepID=A0A4S4LY63_9AGAM|nr:hypothetical protein EW146_g3232 [Bondarzewia mesenterica]